MAFSDHKQITTEQQLHRIMQSPQGRDLGRIFLEEIGKGDKGDFPGAVNEVLNIFAKVLRKLYRSDSPEQSRQNYG